MTSSISDRQFEIIEAAGKILTTSGVSGLTIKNLAKEMKFSESAIYRHFTSKEQIIIAMLEYLAKSMDERYTQAISSKQTPIEKFSTLFQNQFSFFKQNPHFVAAVFSDGLMEESERINETIMKIMSIKMKHLKPIILEGQQKEVFTNSIKSDALCLREKESGSSPSGNSNTLIFRPSSSNKSIPRMEALIPAASPS